MGALTQSVPKPLLAVGGVPIIERILRGLAEAGVGRAVIVTGYLGEQIETFLGDGMRLGLAIQYRRQRRPGGTAEALLLTETLLDGEAFLLGWGDILVAPAFYREFLSAFESSPCDLQLAVNEVDDPWRGGAVYVDAGWRVTQVREKPARGTSQTRWNNAGVFVCTPCIFPYARGVAASTRGEYELPQAIERMVTDGRSVRAVPVRGFWSDVGTAEDLARAERELTAGETGARNRKVGEGRN